MKRSCNYQESALLSRAYSHKPTWRISCSLYCAQCLMPYRRITSLRMGTNVQLLSKYLTKLQHLYHRKTLNYLILLSGYYISFKGMTEEKLQQSNLRKSYRKIIVYSDSCSVVPVTVCFKIPKILENILFAECTAD